MKTQLLAPPRLALGARSLARSLRPALPRLARPVMAAAALAGLQASGCASQKPPEPSPGPTLRQLYGLSPVTQITPSRTALVLVDFQREFLDGRLVVPGGPEAVARAADLLAWARASGVTVAHVRNVTRPSSPIFAPGSPTTEFVAALAPRDGELVVTKPGGGAFTRTDLDAQLKARGVDTIVVGGIMAHLAVAMSAQDGAVLGYRVVVASDATTTRDLPGPPGSPAVGHQALALAVLAALADRFADVMPSGSITALPMAR